MREEGATCLQGPRRASAREQSGDGIPRGSEAERFRPTLSEDHVLVYLITILVRTLVVSLSSS